MAPVDIRKIIVKLYEMTELNPLLDIRDEKGKGHIGRICHVSRNYFVLMIDLEDKVHELIYYENVISIKIETI